MESVVSDRVFSCDTPAPSESERHTFIGGSEAYELLNEKQYGKGCVRALGYRKLQHPEDFPEETIGRRASMRGILKRGHLLEDIAAQLYREETGRVLIRRTRLVRHPEHPGAGVHTDRLILAHIDPRRGELPTGDAEIKTHSEGPFLNIMRRGLPAGHNLQVQWSLFCTNHQWGAFIILGVFGGDANTGLPLRHFDVDRDDGIIEIFKGAVDAFWNTLSKGQLPEPPFPATDPRCRVCPYRLSCRGENIDPEELARVMAEKNDKTPLFEVHHDDLDQALADRALVLGEMAALDCEDEDDPGALQLVTARIKDLIEAARPGESKVALLVNKHWKVYCADNAWSGLDVKQLRLEQPETYKKYYVTRPTGRKRLRVTELAPAEGQR